MEPPQETGQEPTRSKQLAERKLTLYAFTSYLHFILFIGFLKWALCQDSICSIYTFIVSLKPDYPESFLYPTLPHSLESGPLCLSFAVHPEFLGDPPFSVALLTLGVLGLQMHSSGFSSSFTQSL